MKEQKHTPATLLKTDRAIFYYVQQEMLKQGLKSLDSYYDEETGEETEGDECKYFGWSAENDMAVRCAVGFIMNRGLAEDYEVEDKDASDNDVLATVIESNPHWDFKSSSAKMLVVLQTIHDRYPVNEWKPAFEYFQNFFNEAGEFTAFPEDSENLETHEIHVNGKSVEIEIFSTSDIREATRCQIHDNYIKLTLAKIDKTEQVVDIQKHVEDTQEIEKELV